jgi:hypothetical protein
MGGDGLNGLAAAIAVAALALLLGGAALGFALARGVGRAKGWTGARTRAVASLAAAAGLALGGLAVVATFFESTFEPPPRLELAVPAGYAHVWTVLLEDPRAPDALRWEGASLPFAQRRAALAVPPSGIVRVRDLGDARGRGDLDVRWSDGHVANGIGGGPAPEGTGATAYVAVDRAEPGASGPGAELPSDPAAFAAWIAGRERAR